MRGKQLAKEIAKRLKELYPDAKCSLNYGGDPFRLLIMGRLSAQCKDERVNIVCEKLFSDYPTIEDLANALLADVENCIKPLGLYKTKAINIKEAAQIILTKYNGIVPNKMEELLTIPGIGRKTANLILGDIYGIPGIVADTHCIRISGRLGLTPEGEDNPYKVEMALMKIVEPQETTDLCHRMVYFGRDICTARNPKCEICQLNDICRKYGKTKKR